MEVCTKLENYELYETGAYGNRIRTWNSLTDLMLSDYRGLVTLRNKISDRPLNLYAIPFNQVAEKYLEKVKIGYDPRFFTFNETMPDDKLVVQGEVERSETYLNMTYSHERAFMKKALLTPLHATGLRAQTILRHYMTASSYDDLQELFDRFTNAVIEFSTYSICIGDKKGRNTIFWEVRSMY